MDAFANFAQSTYQYNDGSAAGGAVWLFVYLVIVVVVVAGMWKTFQKAGQPGWAVIVPIYNSYIMLKIADRPGWWLLLFLIPFVNIVIAAIVAVDIAQKFGKSDVFGIVALWLFPFVGYPMIGFGEDKYKGTPTDSKDKDK